jgi:hypothetical protein
VKFLLVYLDTDPTPPPDPPLTVTTTFLPNGQVGVAYSATLTATGGTAPYTWETIEPLPDGLSIVGSAITGTPTTEGNFTPRVRVTDSAAASADSGTLPVTIVAAGTVLTITTNTIPNGQVNQVYSAQLAAVGGTAPYTWSVQSGSLPTGLSLNASTGAITGTPTTAGTSNLIFRVTDAVAATDDSGVYSLVIADVAPVLITASSPLNSGAVNEAYTRAIGVTGGTGSYTLTVADGALPNGLSISGMNITGTPTTEQTASFTLRAEDTNGAFHEKSFVLVIEAEGTLEGPHDAFEEWSADASCIISEGLRSQAELNALVTSAPSTYFTYDPGSDTYPDKQDGCKLVRVNTGDGKASVPGNQQLKMDTPISLWSNEDRAIIIWDFWYGPEFRQNFGGVGNYKTFQVGLHGIDWWTLMDNFRTVVFNDTDESLVSSLSNEHRHGQPTPEGDIATSGDQVGPQGAGTYGSGTKENPEYYEFPGAEHGYRLKHSVWTRRWIELRMGVDASEFTEWNAEYGVTVSPNANDPNGGRWNMVSLWAWDEVRGLQRILYRVPMNWAADPTKPSRTPFMARFRFEFNSSKEGFIGPFIGYGRNVVVLKNYMLPDVDPEDDTFIFRRPVR